MIGLIDKHGRPTYLDEYEKNIFITPPYVLIHYRLR